MIALRVLTLSALAAGAAVLGRMSMPTQTQTRTVSENDRWDLSVLYPSPDSWQQARAAFEEKIPALEAGRGRLSESPRRLLETLALASDLQREYQKLAGWARMRSDLDRRSSEDLARAQQIDLTGTKLQAATSFLAPEILSIPEATIREFQGREPGLAVYAHEIDDILRKRPHTLGPAEEKLLADAGAIASSADDIYGVLANAEMPWPELLLSNGERVVLDQAGFSKVRSAPSRADRLAVFRSFFSTWQGYKRTYGVMLDAEIKKNIFYARSRRYGSALEAAVDRNHVPMAVYDAMVEAVNAGLPSLHRYLGLRARILGVKDLGYHDIYAPLVPSSSRSYTVEEAKALVLDSLAPLGEAYTKDLRSGYESRWVDFWPSPAKRSGAYSNGSIYGQHPFILMNYTGNFDAVSTLAHESGHAMHSWLANHAQPFPTAGYSIFVAEVASTFNEALLYRYAIDHARDDEERLSLLSSWLDGARGTFFRQAMFAEFERALASMAERGEALTGDRLSAVYLDLLRKYMGSRSGVCGIDDLYAVEWA